MRQIDEKDSESPRWGRGQAGFGLIEVIISVVIMSTVILSVIAAVLTLQYTSEGHRKTVLSSIEATDVAEAIELLDYVDCAGVSDYSEAFVGTGAGYTASVTKIQYLESGANDTASFVDSCTLDGEGNDEGVQQLTVTVTAGGPRGGSEDIVYTKRDDDCGGYSDYEVVVGADC